MSLLPEGQISLSTTKPKPLPEESVNWYWHPSRCDVQGPPESFAKRLAEFDSELRITWNPVRERWLVWMLKPSVQRSGGWLLLFAVQYSDGTYMPLDDRVFARLYQASERVWGNGKCYFDAVVREQDREKANRQKVDRQESLDRAMPSFEHSQIKVAMRGHSNGSKFANYHA